VTRLERAALRVIRDLEDEGHRGALVGGLAVSARATPRTTRDIDFAVAVSSDTEAERLVYGLRQRGYELYDVFEQTAAKRLATARFRLAPGSVREGAVDLLFASSGIEPEVVAAAEVIEVVPGSPLPVARRGHLLALKVLAHEEDRRPQDRQDIMALLARADEADLRLAHEAIDLITSRGFHRDKVLSSELRRFMDLARQVGEERERGR
jgi:predicted nucleotidyltransferase